MAVGWCSVAHVAHASEHVVHSASASVMTRPTSPSLATSEPAGCINRKRHSTVPSGQRTAVAPAGNASVQLAIHVRVDVDIVSRQRGRTGTG
jgi:hypothetical protein